MADLLPSHLHHTPVMRLQSHQVCHNSAIAQQRSEPLNVSCLQAREVRVALYSSAMQAPAGWARCEPRLKAAWMPTQVWQAATGKVWGEVDDGLECTAV